MEFKIIAPGGNEIELTTQMLSAPIQGGLIFNESIIAKAEFGKMIFNN